MLDARIVGNNGAAAGVVAKQADDGRMGAAENADDAAFGAAGTGNAAEAGDFSDDGVAVHSVLDEIARDEKIAIDTAQRRIRNNEAVTIVVENQTALDFVARRGRAGSGGIARG